MKKGTLNKLFGKKSSSSGGGGSLYADNPPWMVKPQAKKASVDYHDEIHNTFSFLDDSGTATLKARPGPRVRPVIQMSTSQIDSQGLAVPTPSVPQGFSDNASLGPGAKLNGNYRMYSSVGDLRLTNYYDDYNEEIPAPPSVPPPPPPSALPPAPPTESLPASTMSSPTSPSPPDFIPPTPNSSAPIFLPSTNGSSGPVKSENVNPVTKDMQMTLPNRFSLNTAGFQQSRGQATHEVEPNSIPKPFKIPPPAPTRSSSMQLQETQNISYSKEPPPSPVPSSFKPSVQAKLFAPGEGQKSLNDTLNKRKSMLIMEDLQDQFQSLDTVDNQKNGSESLPLTSSTNLKTGGLDNESKTGNGVVSNSRFKMELDPKKQFNKINMEERALFSNSENGEVSQHPVSSIELNKITFNKERFMPNGHRSPKPSVKALSLKPILTDLSIPDTQLKQNHLTRNETFSKAISEQSNDIKGYQERSAEGNYQEAPPSPPPMAPPAPPMMIPPKPPTVPPPPPPTAPVTFMPPVTVTPPKTSPMMPRMLTKPSPPVMASMPPVAPASPLLSSKPKNNLNSSPPSVPAPPPLKAPLAPPAPPPLPSQNVPMSPEAPPPLLKALQEKQQTLKQIPKKSIEVRAAQVSSISIATDDGQKERVGKIKGELEALFSPKKGKSSGEPTNYPSGQDTNKTNHNTKTNQVTGGENTIVNSLMLKVPLLPSDYPKADVDEDNSEWIPKSTKTEFEFPEIDYSPRSPTQKVDQPRYSYSEIKTGTVKSIAETMPKPVSPPEDTATKLKSDVPAYKPHHERKASAGRWTLDTMHSAALETTVKQDLPSKEEATTPTNTYVKEESPKKEEESINKHPVTGDQIEANSPLALLMAAKKRAQKGNRAATLERSNLPKISVSSGIASSSFSSQYNEGKGNTFVVDPKKENGRMYSQEEVTSFSSKPTSNFNQISTKSRWADEGFQSSSIGNLEMNPQKSDDEKVNSIYTRQSSTEAGNKDPHVQNYVSPIKSTFINPANFSISSVPSPVPASKTDELLDYEIIPPPAEFMNSPPSSNIYTPQNDRPYIGDNGSKSDLSYQWNSGSNPNFVSQTTSRNSIDSDKYTSDNYSTGVNRDPQRSSLIKARLYLPDPESSGNYGKNTNSMRSSTLPGSYTMADPRHSNNPQRYSAQGRRVSSENVNKMASTLPAGNPQTRNQNARPGMTFTVRPGTKQPISQMYQGGYM